MSYDPTSPNEEKVILPSAPRVTLSAHADLQPPLSRRGSGPGLVIFLPQADQIELRTSGAKPLDPEPVHKWAEEGFAVVGVTASETLSVADVLKLGLDSLQALDTVDIKDKFGVIVYDRSLIFSVSQAAASDTRVAAFIGYGSFAAPELTIPIVLHLTANAPRPATAPTEVTVQYTYNTTSAAFVLPQAAQYDQGSASIAHSRTLAFLRKWLGGPFFDIEAIWDEHSSFEFEARSVAKTMGTMVEEPYVNNIPTMTGGVGRKSLTAFYRDHFIFANPDDARLQVVSRTVGADRIIDEFVYHFTHDKVIDWMLPGIPPTGKAISVPVVAVVNVRGDRLYNEHIWWDQATVLRQLGILPTHLPYRDPQTGNTISIHLPVVGVEGTNKLIDENNGESNQMLEPGW